jgi:predicted O-methyltransferase YrrM
MTTLINDPALKALLDRLHARSDAEAPGLGAYFSKRLADGSLSSLDIDQPAERFLGDKLVALDRDKALFCHLLCRSLRAKRVVEAGTSFGVSTLYLAAAVRHEGGVVIATEHEPKKAAAAQAHFDEAGLSPHIDLRIGDLRQTLKVIEGPVDFALIDIWTPMARPALELIAPHLRKGAIVVSDNTTTFREAYADYLAFIADPNNGLASLTLPFAGGLEFTVRV